VPPATTHTDPRSIVTPEAFEVADDLLGRPLAAPGRRFVALAVDLLVVGVITAITRSFAVVLGVVAAGFFIRAGFKRTPVRGSVFGRAMRASVGCLGVFIGLTTAVVWTSCGLDFDGDPAAEAGGDGPGRGGARVAGAIAAALTRAGLDIDVFEDATTLEAAEEIARFVIEEAEREGVERADVRTVLFGSIPDDAPWAAESEQMIDRLLASAYEEAEAVPTSIGEEVAGYSTVEALDAYARALEVDSADVETDARVTALRARLVGEVAADTVVALSDRISDLEATNRRQASELEDVADELEEATSRGFVDWVVDLADELGFGFGWWTLYTTILLSWWNGQTVGKRLLGLRVMRLDGEPVNWWTAFERAGGYVAGFATGLLGFVQVYWDSNRQAIHDRIVGTVVVVDGAEKVIDWESAL
jgi:hypothetical protein